MEFYKRREKFFKENFIFVWNPLKTSGISDFLLEFVKKLWNIFYSSIFIQILQEYTIFLENIIYSCIFMQKISGNKSGKDRGKNYRKDSRDSD